MANDKPLVEKWKEKGISEEIASEDDENDTVEAVCFLGYEVVQDLKELLEEVKETEESELNKMPEEVRLKFESAYLLGYAHCWNKINVAIFASEDEKVKE